MDIDWGDDWDDMNLDTDETPRRDDGHCPICYEALSETEWIWIASSRYCKECAKPYLTNKIKDAINNELYYPIQEGRETLLIIPFVRLIDDNALLKLYCDRGQDYAVPPPQRRYCKHKIRVGDRPEDPYLWTNPKTWMPPVALSVETETCGFQLRAPTEDLLDCSSCSGLTCANCTEPIYGVNVDHYCPIKEEAEEEEDRFAGQVRGKDYQICPNELCQMPVQLWDACNHMVCAKPSCRTDFCFVCGERAIMADEHWGEYEDQCPLYGQPGPPGTRRARPAGRNPQFQALWDQPPADLARMGLHLDRLRPGNRFLRFPDLPPPDIPEDEVRQILANIAAEGNEDLLRPEWDDFRLLATVTGSWLRTRYPDPVQDRNRLLAMIALAVVRAVISQEESQAMLDQLELQGPPPQDVWDLDGDEVQEEVDNNGQPWWEPRDHKVQDPRRLEILLNRGFELGLWDWHRAQGIFMSNNMRTARWYRVYDIVGGNWIDEVEWPRANDEFPLRIGDCDPPEWYEDMNDEERNWMEP